MDSRYKYHLEWFSRICCNCQGHRRVHFLKTSHNQGSLGIIHSMLISTYHHMIFPGIWFYHLGQLTKTMDNPHSFLEQTLFNYPHIILVSNTFCHHQRALWNLSTWYTSDYFYIVHYYLWLSYFGYSSLVANQKLVYLELSSSPSFIHFVELALIDFANLIVPGHSKLLLVCTIGFSSHLSSSQQVLTDPCCLLGLVESI